MSIIDEAAVLRYQEDRLREKAAPKSINEEVRFLLKGKKLQFVQPQLVDYQLYPNDIGYLKVAMFPGMVGVDVATEISRAIEELGNVKGLVIDLRGNTGGGAGALRVMSLLRPVKIPIGFAPNRKWASKNLDRAKLSFPRFNRIPSKKSELWTLAVRFMPSLLSKSPVVVETEGLGPKPFHGKIALLVDRHKRVRLR